MAAAAAAAAEASAGSAALAPPVEDCKREREPASNEQAAHITDPPAGGDGAEELGIPTAREFAVALMSHGDDGQRALEAAMIDVSGEVGLAILPEDGCGGLEKGHLQGFLGATPRAVVSHSGTSLDGTALEDLLPQTRPWLSVGVPYIKAQVFALRVPGVFCRPVVDALAACPNISTLSTVAAQGLMELAWKRVWILHTIDVLLSMLYVVLLVQISASVRSGSALLAEWWAILLAITCVDGLGELFAIFDAVSRFDVALSMSPDHKNLMIQTFGHLRELQKIEHSEENSRHVEEKRRIVILKFLYQVCGTRGIPWSIPLPECACKRAHAGSDDEVRTVGRCWRWRHIWLRFTHRLLWLILPVWFYILSFKNILDIGGLFLDGLGLQVLWDIRSAPDHLRVGERGVLAAWCAVRWIRVLYLLRGYRALGTRLLPILYACRDTAAFLVVVIFSLAASVHAYYVLALRSEPGRFYSAFLPMFRLSILGDFDLFELEGADPTLVPQAGGELAPDDPAPTEYYMYVHTLFLFTAGGITVGLMNLLVGVLSANYDRYESTSDALFAQSRCALVASYSANPLVRLPLRLVLELLALCVGCLASWPVLGMPLRSRLQEFTRRRMPSDSGAAGFWIGHYRRLLRPMGEPLPDFGLFDSAPPPSRDGEEDSFVFLAARDTKGEVLEDVLSTRRAVQMACDRAVGDAKAEVLRAQEQLAGRQEEAMARLAGELGQIRAMLTTTSRP